MGRGKEKEAPQQINNQPSAYLGQWEVSRDSGRGTRGAGVEAWASVINLKMKNRFLKILFVPAGEASHI